MANSTGSLHYLEVGERMGDASLQLHGGEVRKTLMEKENTCNTASPPMENWR
jgi:hypothetical protein